MGKIDDLASKVRKHNKFYWIDHAPEISDQAYDQLVEELRALAPSHPVLTEMVEDSSGGKIKHDVPMLSLDKVFTVDDVAKWAENSGAFAGEDSGLVASYKVDGSSCSLLYENGTLVRAATRGNGREGDDITANARMVSGIRALIHPISRGPRQLISSKQRLEVRGEIYMTNASFERAIERFEKRLRAGEANESDRPSNPRNYCAGSIKHKDPNVTKERDLSFMAHGLLLQDDSPKSEYEVLKVLEALGFKTPVFGQVALPADIQATVDEIGAKRGSFPYDTDGIVFAANSLSLHRELGETSHHPRYRIAFKFARERGETEIVGIKWITSRTGRVVPTIEMKPIELGGATVTFCTGHNAKNVRDLSLSPGTRVLMEREVIPYLVKKVADGQGASLPKACDSCGGELAWDETETDLVCPNASGCRAQLFGYVCHYVSRKVANMMGVGEELIAKLIEAGLVASPADLFRLTERQILDSIDRQGESSAKKVISAIQERREQDLATFLYGLGIPDLGNTVSQRFAEHFKTLDAVLAANEADMLAVDKIGEKLATSISRGLHSRKALISDLLSVVSIRKVQEAAGSLVGKTFCLTGHVEIDVDGKKYDSRPDIEDLIKARGGKIKSVSKGLDFLVAGSDAGSKLEKAKKAGIKIVDEAALARMLKS